MDTILSSFGNVLANTFAATYVIMIFIAPLILGFICFEAFMVWKRNVFIKEKLSDAVLLELTLPQEMLKSPLAMELFLTGVYQTSGETTFIDTMFKGKTRPWFSLELVSLGGNIKFFIWTWKFWKPVITSYLYAQFPEIEVREVEDYANKVHFDESKNDIFGTEFTLSKPTFYPIKTYVDYGLGNDPKEEFKIDPMTPFLEYLTTIGPGEQIWLQIIARAHKSEIKKAGTWFEKVDWKHAAKEEIKKLKGQDVQSAGEIKISGVSLSKGERDVIDAIERNVSKLAYDCAIRIIYIAENGKFNDINKPALVSAFRQYNTAHLNSFAVVPDHTTSFDYPWQDIFGKKLKERKEHLLHSYLERSAFHAPHKSHYFTINTEGLATIYHFPGQTAKAPGLQRVNAKKTEAPSNLPI